MEKPILAVMLGSALCLAACPSKPKTADKGKSEPGKPDPDKPPARPTAGPWVWDDLSPLLAPVVPADNPVTIEKVALGKMLFFDKRLSKDGSASCQTCHQHDKAWTDGIAFSTKVGTPTVLNTRNAPTLYNTAYQTSWYWDGRATSLEQNVIAAWEKQMGADRAAVATTLAAIPAYADAFQKAFGGPPTGDNIAQAIATFLRTLRSGGSPWDRYEAGQHDAVSTSAVDGYKIFTGKGQCVLCHVPPLYTDGLFHNVGIEAGKETQDPGRFKVTSDVKDTGAFKTPTLRAASKGAPYFHDASAATLEEAVRYMASGGKDDPYRDPRLKPANLNDEEIQAVVAFLTALASSEPFEPPIVP